MTQIIKIVKDEMILMNVSFVLFLNFSRKSNQIITISVICVLYGLFNTQTASLR